MNYRIKPGDKLKIGKLYREDTGRVLIITARNKSTISGDEYLFYYLDKPDKLLRIHEKFVNYITEIN